jgi:hypothetical protein
MKAWLTCCLYLLVVLLHEGCIWRGNGIFRTLTPIYVKTGEYTFNGSLRFSDNYLFAVRILCCKLSIDSAVFYIHDDSQPGTISFIRGKGPTQFSFTGHSFHLLPSSCNYVTLKRPDDYSILHISHDDVVDDTTITDTKVNKVILVIGRGGPLVCEMSRLPDGG